MLFGTTLEKAILNLNLDNLTRLAASSDSFAWGSSLAVHLAGAMIAWSTLASQVWDTAPELPGRKTRVQLLANWSEPTPPEETDEPRAEIDVVVTPDRVQIDHRVYTKTSTDVSRPNPSLSPSELKTGQLPAMADQQRSPLAEESGPKMHMPPKPLLQRTPRAARLPTVEIAMPASVHVEPSVNSGNYLRPKLLENRPPDYPPQAVSARIEGIVMLRVHISDTGSVRHTEIIKSTGHALLDAAAVRAVTVWRFAPARRNGRPVPATVRLPVRFSLD